MTVKAVPLDWDFHVPTLRRGNAYGRQVDSTVWVPTENRGKQELG